MMKQYLQKQFDVSVPRPMNYQKIIQINKGTVPLILTDVPDLELGPTDVV